MRDDGTMSRDSATLNVFCVDAISNVFATIMLPGNDETVNSNLARYIEKQNQSYSKAHLSRLTFGADEIVHLLDPGARANSEDHVFVHLWVQKWSSRNSQHNNSEIN